MSKPPVSEQVQVNFRMPVELRDRLKLWASEAGRSLNAEIIARLERSFDHDLNSAAAVQEQLASLERSLLAQFKAMAEQARRNENPKK